MPGSRPQEGGAPGEPGKLMPRAGRGPEAGEAQPAEPGRGAGLILFILLYGWNAFSTAQGKNLLSSSQLREVLPLPSLAARKHSGAVTRAGNPRGQPPPPASTARPGRLGATRSPGGPQQRPLSRSRPHPCGPGGPARQRALQSARSGRRAALAGAGRAGAGRAGGAGGGIRSPPSPSPSPPRGPAAVRSSNAKAELRARGSGSPASVSSGRGLRRGSARDPEGGPAPPPPRGPLGRSREPRTPAPPASAPGSPKQRCRQSVGGGRPAAGPVAAAAAGPMSVAATAGGGRRRPAVAPGRSLLHPGPR